LSHLSFPFQKSIEQLTDKLINRPESIDLCSVETLSLQQEIPFAKFPTKTGPDIGFVL
jgi:hypothetical protein